MFFFEANRSGMLLLVCNHPHTVTILVCLDNDPSKYGGPQRRVKFLHREIFFNSFLNTNII